MNDKTFEKINIKIVISMKKCTPAQSFSQFGGIYPKNMT